MTYAMLYQMLVEAEDRCTDKWPADVRERSQETVELIEQRMKAEGLTRYTLAKLARKS